MATQQVSYSLLQSVQSPVQWALRTLSRVWGSRPAKLTVHLYRVPGLKTGAVIPSTSLVPLWDVHSYIQTITTNYYQSKLLKWPHYRLVFIMRLFQSRPRHRQSEATNFVEYIKPPRKYQDSTPNKAENRFLPRSFQFIIQ